MYIYIYISATGPLVPEWSDRGSTGAPWKVGLLNYREPPPHYSHDPAWPSMTFFRSFFGWFFNIVFNALLDRFWCQVAPNLASKIDQKSIQEPSKIYPKFYLVSSTFSNRFLIDFGSNLGPSNPPFTLKKQWFLKIFMILLDCLLDGLEANLSPFWEVFGSQVGTKLAPNRSKNRSQKQSKNWSHFVSIFGRLLLDFGANLDPNLGEQRFVMLTYVGFWGPWSPQETLRIDFGPILDWFWTDFG